MMTRLRVFLRRVSADRRVLLGIAVVVLLVVAAVGDLPTRLGHLVPEDPVATTTPAVAPVRTGPTPVPTGLTSTVTRANTRLTACTPGIERLSRCGRAPTLGPGPWIGSSGVSIDSLEGRVAIVFVFSGSCVECRRESRYLRAWQAAYDDLAIVGVHAPQFSFETDDTEVEQTVADLSLGFPVLMDDARATMDRYRAAVRPTTYLIDRFGTVRAITIGDHGSQRLERQVRKLLTEDGSTSALPRPVGSLDDGGDATRGTPPQIKLGSTVGSHYDAEVDGIIGREQLYRLTKRPRPGIASIGGRWRVDPESAVPKARAVGRVTFGARRAYVLVGGRGWLEVSTSEGVSRRIPVRGRPDFVQVYAAPKADRETLTIRFRGQLEVFSYAFG